MSVVSEPITGGNTATTGTATYWCRRARSHEHVVDHESRTRRPRQHAECRTPPANGQIPGGRSSADWPILRPPPRVPSRPMTSDSCLRQRRPGRWRWTDRVDVRWYDWMLVDDRGTADDQCSPTPGNSVIVCSRVLTTPTSSNRCLPITTLYTKARQLYTVFRKKHFIIFSLYFPKVCSCYTWKSFWSANPAKPNFDPNVT